MAFFWLNWMGYIYGDETEEPRFEADWLAVKSNRSVVMMLFDQEGEKVNNHRQRRWLECWPLKGALKPSYLFQLSSLL
jgi:hypothetical protein